MHDLTIEFQDFFEKITLHKTQSERIDSAVEALTEFLKKEYELRDSDIFIQGSFSTNTVVCPAPSDKNGEYDVDIIALCADTEDTPSEALNTLEERIESNGNYKDKIERDEPKIPCIRLRYADENNARFHVDVVPAKREGASLIQIPRKNTGWEISNPEGFTDWVKNQGERYRRTVMMLKRWRDENKVPIKSIVLQVIVADYLSEDEDDAINIRETFEAMAKSMKDLQSIPEITNPVLEGEIITKKWNNENFLEFTEKLEETVEIISSAFEETDHDEAASLWQKIFGDDFIFESDKVVTLGKAKDNLGDTSHADKLVFPFRPQESISVKIDGYFNNPWKKMVYKKNKYIEVSVLNRKRKIKSGEEVESNGHLDYYAVVEGLKGKNYEIHWQVVNTGGEAKRADGLRGNFFVSRNTNNRRHNYEQTSYEGTHWIECFLILDGTCVAKSGRFYITIFHKKKYCS